LEMKTYEKIIDENGIELSENVKDRFSSIDTCFNQVCRALEGDLDIANTSNDSIKRDYATFKEALEEFSDYLKEYLLTREYPDDIPDSQHTVRDTITDKWQDILGATLDPLKPHFNSPYLDNGSDGFLFEKTGDMMWPAVGPEGAGFTTMWHNVMKATDHIVELCDHASSICRTNPKLIKFVPMLEELKILGAKKMNKNEEGFDAKLESVRSQLDERRIPERSSRAKPITNQKIEQVEFALNALENTVDERSTQFEMYEITDGKHRGR